MQALGVGITRILRFAVRVQPLRWDSVGRMYKGGNTSIHAERNRTPRAVHLQQHQRARLLLTWPTERGYMNNAHASTSTQPPKSRVHQVPGTQPPNQGKGKVSIRRAERQGRGEYYRLYFGHLFVVACGTDVILARFTCIIVVLHVLVAFVADFFIRSGWRTSTGGGTLGFSHANVNVVGMHGQAARKVQTN